MSRDLARASAFFRESVPCPCVSHARAHFFRAPVFFTRSCVSYALVRFQEHFLRFYSRGIFLELVCFSRECAFFMHACVVK